MQTKLQELTDKIYQEGVQKARDEADQLLKKAHAEAESILSKANQEAVQIQLGAEKQAAENKRNMESEMKLAASQALNALKQQMAGILTLKVVDPAVDAVFSNPEYVQKLISELVKGFQQKGAIDLRLLLPVSDQDKMNNFVRNSFAAELNQGLEIGFSSKIKAGLKIGPKDGSYLVSFTDEDFKNFLKSYIRTQTAEMLFENH